MNDQTGDLSALTLGPDVAENANAGQSRIPLPRVRWRTRVLLPALILLTTTALVGFSSRDALRPATSVKVVPVLAKAGGQLQQAGEVIVQAPGWVEADPYATAVSALTDGIVEAVLVLEGDRVELGQVVAELVADDARLALGQAEARLDEQRAAAAVARAAFEEAQRNWDHPIELTRALQTAEAQLAEKRAELDRWPSELAREEALAVYLDAESERLTPLHENGQASDIEMIRSRQAHLAQRAEVETVRRRKPMLEAQIRALEAEVTAAGEHLRLRIADTRALAAAEAAVREADAAVVSAQSRRDEAALRLERMEVRAASAGVVMARLAEPGSKLMLGMDDPRSAQVVRLYDPQKLQVRVDVPLADAARIGLGQPAEIIVDVMPDHVFKGCVVRVVHEADVQKNTLQFKVAIENPSPEIKPEMLARARFLAKSDTSVAENGASTLRLFVPASAVFQRDGASYVWLADPINETAVQRKITARGAAVDGTCAVLDGLQLGDRVIVAPPADLEEGGRIRAIEN